MKRSLFSKLLMVLVLFSTLLLAGCKAFQAFKTINTYNPTQAQPTAQTTQGTNVTTGSSSSTTVEPDGTHKVTVNTNGDISVVSITNLNSLEQEYFERNEEVIITVEVKLGYLPVVLNDSSSSVKDIVSIKDLNASSKYTIKFKMPDEAVTINLSDKRADLVIYIVDGWKVDSSYVRHLTFDEAYGRYDLNNTGKLKEEGIVSKINKVVPELNTYSVVIFDQKTFNLTLDETRAMIKANPADIVIAQDSFIGGDLSIKGEAKAYIASPVAYSEENHSINVSILSTVGDSSLPLVSEVFEGLTHINIPEGEGIEIIPTASQTETDPTKTGPYTIVKDGVQLDVSKGVDPAPTNQSGTAQSMRIYKNETATLTAPQGYVITKIEVNADTYKNQYSAKSFTVVIGSYKADADNLGVWEGAATQVVFTATSAQVRVYAFVVYLAEAGDTQIDTSFNINVVKPEYVTVTGLPQKAEAGDLIEFTATAAGYNITVRLNGEELTPQNGIYSFTMPEKNANISITADEDGKATFDATVDIATIPNADGRKDTIVKSGVILKAGMIEHINSSGSFYDLIDGTYANYRIYGGSYFTLTAPTGYVITSIVLESDTANGSAPTKHAISILTADKGTLDVSDATAKSGTWTGRENSVKFSASESAYITKITVLFEPAELPSDTYTVTKNATGASFVGLLGYYKAGETVEFTVNISEGYEEPLVVKLGNEVLTKGTNGKYSFTMPQQAVTVTAVATEKATPQPTSDWTFDFTTSDNPYPNVTTKAGAQTATVGEFTVTFTDAFMKIYNNVNYINMRYQSANTVTITASGKKIVKIVFEGSNPNADPKTYYVLNNLVPSTGSITEAVAGQYTITWEGEGTEISFTNVVDNTNCSVGITKIRVFTEEGGETPPVEPEYTISYTEVAGVNLTIKVNGTEATKGKVGDTVEISASLQEGYENLHVLVDGAEVALTNGKYEFTLGEKNVAVSASATSTTPVSGATVEFTPTGTAEAGYYTETKDGVKLEISNGIVTSGQYRTYAHSALEITAPAGYVITKVEITAVLNSSKGCEQFVADGGNYTYAEDKKSGTWTGSLSTVALFTEAQVRMTSIRVTYAQGESGEVVDRYLVLLEKDEKSSGSYISTKTSCKLGESSIITLKFDNGYELYQILVNGVDKSTDVADGKLTVEPTEDVTVQIISKGIEKTVFVTSTEHVTADESYTEVFGKSIVINLSVAQGYSVASATINGQAVQVVENVITLELNAENVQAWTDSDGKMILVLTEASNTQDYEVSIVQPAHGTIAVSPTHGTVGTEVEITVTPDTNYVIKKVLVNNIELLPDENTGKYIFNIAGETTVTASLVDVNEPVVLTLEMDKNMSIEGLPSAANNTKASYDLPFVDGDNKAQAVSVEANSVYYTPANHDYLMFGKTNPSYLYNTVAIPGAIQSITITTGSGASTSAEYLVTFGTSPLTTKASGTGDKLGKSGTKEYTCDVDGATYFQITSLNKGYNAQVAKIVIKYSVGGGSVTPIVEEYSVTVGNHENVTVTGIQEGKYGKGSLCTFEVTPLEHYEIVSVKAGSTTLPPVSVGHYEFVVNEDTEITVEVAKVKYTITWLMDDGITEIDHELVEYGETPSHVEPVKDSTDQYTYTFTGWSPEITPVTVDASYTAVFTPVVRSYTITWLMDDDSEISHDLLWYGDMPTYNGEEPTKESTAQYTYTFTGWTPEIAQVSGDASYKATFESHLRSYEIIWLMDDDSVIYHESVEYGATPSHIDPIKDPTAQYTYTFSGWSPEIAQVTEDATYKATFESHLRSYTITWLLDDNSVIEEETYEYGELPHYTIPSKAADLYYTYESSEWTPGLVEVVGDATYKATYLYTPIEYDFVLSDFDDHISASGYPSKVKIGDNVVINIELDDNYNPLAYINEKQLTITDNKITLEFNEANMSSWINNNQFQVEISSSDVIYDITLDTSALVNLSASMNTEKQIAGGIVVVTIEEINPGYRAIVKVGETEYPVDEWNMAEVPISGTTTITVTEALKEFTVIFKNGEDIIETDNNVTYGTNPSYDGITPTKTDPNGVYSYSFNGWTDGVNNYDPVDPLPAVTSNVTYSARWTESFINYSIVLVDNNFSSSMTSSKDNAHQGEEITISVTLKDGYSTPVITVEDKNGSPIEVNGLTFVMPASDVTVYLEATAIDYSITFDQGTGFASLSTSPEIKAHVGDEITVSYTLLNGFENATILVNNGAVELVNGKFTMPASNVVIKATATPTVYTITRDYDGSIITLVTEDSAATYSTVHVMAEVSDGYTLTVTFKAGDNDPIEIVLNENGEGAFTMRPCDVTIYAVATPIVYTITKGENPTGATFTIDLTEAHYNDVVTVEVSLDEEYEIVSVTAGEAEAVLMDDVNHTYMFTVTKDVTVNVTVKKHEYNITYPESVTGVSSITFNGVKTKGDTASITVIPETGYEVMVKYGDNRVALTDNEFSWTVTGDAAISIYACQPVYSFNNDYSAVLKTLDFGQGEPDVITVSTIESKSVSEMITVIQKLGGTGSNEVKGTTLYKVSGYALDVANDKFGNMKLYDSQNGNSLKVYGTSAIGTGFTLSRSESDPYYSALYTNPKNFLSQNVPVVDYDYITMIVLPIDYNGTYEIVGFYLSEDSSKKQTVTIVDDAGSEGTIAANAVVTGAGEYAYGEHVTVTITPNSGYAIQSIHAGSSNSIDGISFVTGTSPVEFDMGIGAITIRVKLIQATAYQLTVNSDPADQVEGAGEYIEGANIILTPKDGYVFDTDSITATGVTINPVSCSTIKICFTMPGNNVTVNVDLKPLATQSINLYANSSVNTATNQYTLTNGVGKVVIDKATASSDFNASDSDMVRIFKNMNATISANGAQITKVVFTCMSSSYASDMVDGTWPDGANATASGSVVTVTIPQLTEILFKASKAQVRVSNVEITYIIPEGTHTITMTGDTTNVSALKSLDKANYSFGDSVTVTLTPTEGTRIDSVNVTGANATISNDKRTITFAVLTSDISVEVLTSLPHNIAVTNNNEQSTVVLKVGEDTVSQAYVGDTVNIQVSPIGYYAVDTITVKKVSDDSVIAVTNGTFTMPDEAVSVEVVMRAVAAPNAINLAAVEHGTVTFNVDGTPTSPAQASEGSTVEIVITPDSGYELDSITVVKSSDSSSITVTDNTFVMPDGAVVVTVVMKEAVSSSTYTHTFASGELKTNAGDVELTDVTWTQTAATYIAIDSSRGMQIGSSKKPTNSFALSTSEISGTITKITVNACIASDGTAELSITIGGEPIVADQTLTTTATDYAYEDLSLSGDVVISFSNTAKAFYIKSITIEYIPV